MLLQERDTELEKFDSFFNESGATVQAKDKEIQNLKDALDASTREFANSQERARSREEEITKQLHQELVMSMEMTDCLTVPGRSAAAPPSKGS